MSAVNKKTFEVEQVKLAVLRPTLKVTQEAQLVYNRAFRTAVSPPDGQKGALVRAKVEQVLREQNLWNEDKQAQYDGLMKRLLGGEKKLAMGGNAGLTKQGGREVAIDMMKARAGLRSLNAERNALDEHTAESQALQARFNYLVSACTVYGDTGKSYYSSVEDYLGRESDPVAGPAANALGKLIYDLDDDYEQKLPEVKFLIRYGFADEKGRLIRADKKLIDWEGNLIDEKGRRVNEKGELIDLEGTPLTEEGEYKVEFKEFLDEAEASPPPGQAE
jgi:hypothetical protein